MSPEQEAAREAQWKEEFNAWWYNLPPTGWRSEGTCYLAGRRAEAAAHTIPEGWLLAPKEATPDMVIAAVVAMKQGHPISRTYTAMLAAVPKPEGEKG